MSRKLYARLDMDVTPACLAHIAKALDLYIPEAEIDGPSLGGVKQELLNVANECRASVQHIAAGREMEVPL